jgi:uncharacterized membrane protein YfcA
MIDLSVALFFMILSFGASFVNGAIGYGYSSTSIPLAILVYASRIVNPAYVLLESFLNTFMLVLSGRKRNSQVLKRNVPILSAVIPGVIVGSLTLSLVSPGQVRLLVYAVLLPLILLQVAGLRRPIRAESSLGVPLGTGVGALYSLTTISGPPIALFWNNQGLAGDEFKAAVAQIRVVESCSTVILYYLLGLFTPQSLSIFSLIAPPVLLGLPLGILATKKVEAETFRRMCMGFDSIIVAYGLSRVLAELTGIGALVEDILFLVLLVLTVLLLANYFRNRRMVAMASETDRPGRRASYRWPLPNHSQAKVNSYVQHFGLKVPACAICVV